jgi:hypothetical protein
MDSFLGSVSLASCGFGAVFEFPHPMSSLGASPCVAIYPFAEGLHLAIERRQHSGKTAALLGRRHGSRGQLCAAGLLARDLPRSLFQPIGYRLERGGRVLALFSFRREREPKFGQCGLFRGQRSFELGGAFVELSQRRLVAGF